MPALKTFLRHLDARTDPRAAALVRIMMGLMGLMTALVTYRDLRQLLMQPFIRGRQFPWVPDIDLSYVTAFAAIWSAAGIAFALGWFTRTSGLVLWVAILYRHLLDQSLHQNYIPLIGLFSGLLALGNAGAVYSLDSLRRRGPIPLVPLWPQTLIKFQLSVVYFYTAIAKINPNFLEGETFRTNMAFLPFDHPLIWTTMSVATILTELFFAFGLWNRRTRPWATLIGTVFHTGILFVLGFYAALIGFSVIFISAYLLFFEYTPGSYLVIWDDACSSCRGWITWSRRLDWLGVLRFAPSRNAAVLDAVAISPEEASTGMKLCLDSKVFGGFEAVRRILEILPVSFTLAPILRVQPIRAIGTQLYRRVRPRVSHLASTI